MIVMIKARIASAKDCLVSFAKTVSTKIHDVSIDIAACTMVTFIKVKRFVVSLCAHPMRTIKSVCNYAAFEFRLGLAGV